MDAPKETETKVALVTGGNRGYGFCVCQRLREQGFAVVMGSRSLEKGQKAALKFEGDGTTVSVIRLDLADQDSIQSAANQIQDEFGRLDVLVNNAGILLEYSKESQTHTDMEQFEQTMDINFNSTVRVIKAFLPLLTTSKGRVITVASGAGQRTLDILDTEHKSMLCEDTSLDSLNSVISEIRQNLKAEGNYHGRIMTFAYGLSKGMLLLHTRDLAFHNPDVYFFAVSPGLIATDMTSDYDGPKTPKNPYEMAEICEFCATRDYAIHSGTFLRIRKQELSVEPILGDSPKIDQDVLKHLLAKKTMQEK